MADDETGTAASLPPVARPNGEGVYRPRKIVAFPVGSQCGDDDFAGVVVFGTHDPERARVLANALVRHSLDPGYEVAEPRLVWWRDGFEYGQRTFLTDEITGRAGVFFADLIEREDAHA